MCPGLIQSVLADLSWCSTNNQIADVTRFYCWPPNQYQDNRQQHLYARWVTVVTSGFDIWQRHVWAVCFPLYPVCMSLQCAAQLWDKFTMTQLIEGINQCRETGRLDNSFCFHGYSPSQSLIAFFVFIFLIFNNCKESFYGSSYTSI